MMNFGDQGLGVLISILGFLMWRCIGLYSVISPLFLYEVIRYLNLGAYSTCVHTSLSLSLISLFVAMNLGS
ncbi:hypothetical protein SASPL_109483 [Salvia splendens]|uniref:Uncharacterized protein n=1 Tax=Salvia splendens TaxID=180675 RepID=A0A8X8YGL7_SALSN|nr:hypothetical protein SASPL_109483 [Salvia splendens]